MVEKIGEEKYILPQFSAFTALAFNHIPKIGFFFLFFKKKRVLNCNVLSVLCKISPYIVYYVICQTQLETNQPLQFYDLTDFIPNEI